MEWIIWIIVGAIGGYLASFFVKVPIGGLIGNIVAGIAGGLLVGWLSSLLPALNLQVSGLNCASIIAAFIGAVIICAVVSLLTRGRA